MTKVVALARDAARQTGDRVRAAIVLGCAAALILADKTLPF